MLEYRNLEALAAVIEHQGFEKAGQHLHITQSAVTQRIRQLEELTGQILLIRSQPPQTTPAGRLLLEHFKKVHVLEQEFSTHSGLLNTSQKPEISLAVNADSLATWFPKVASRYFAQYDGYLTIQTADQAVTHKLMTEGRVMGCISSLPTPFRGCKRDFLGNMVYCFTATSSFAQRWFPNGVDAASFEQAPKLNFNRDDQLLAQWASQFFTLENWFQNSHFIPSSEQFPLLIREGNVCGMLPQEQYEAYKNAYDLIDLSGGNPIATPLYWHRWSIASTELDTLTQLITEAAGEAACLPAVR